jgi:hypothetical protein
MSRASMLFLSCLVLVAVPMGAWAQQRPGIRMFVTPPEGCYVAGAVDPDNLYLFTKMQVQALWLARNGERENMDVLTAGSEMPMNQVPRLIRGLREDRIESTCAAYVVQAYTLSKNDGVATIAKFLVSSYQELSGMNDQMLEIILQGTADKSLAATRGRLSAWNAKRKDIVKHMTESVGFSLALLIDGNRRNAEGEPDHLILTRAQRDDLVNDLNNKFPLLKNQEKTEHASDFMPQAALFRSFLLGKYRPADEQ